MNLIRLTLLGLLAAALALATLAATKSNKSKPSHPAAPKPPDFKECIAQKRKTTPAPAIAHRDSAPRIVCSAQSAKNTIAIISGMQVGVEKNHWM